MYIKISFLWLKNSFEEIQQNNQNKDNTIQMWSVLQKVEGDMLPLSQHQGTLTPRQLSG